MEVKVESEGGRDVNEVIVESRRALIANKRLCSSKVAIEDNIFTK